MRVLVILALATMLADCNGDRPLDVRDERSLSGHDCKQICLASLAPLASNASVGLPSTSSVKTRECSDRWSMSGSCQDQTLIDRQSSDRLE
jgi:hypothetical protein